jgi:hypothetical protein
MKNLASHVAGLIEEKTGTLDEVSGERKDGVKLTNLLSPEQVKLDLVSHVAGVVKEKTELDITGLLTYDSTQKTISEFVKQKLAELVVDGLRVAAVEFADPNKTVEELLSMVHRAQEAKGIRVRDVALGTAASFVVRAYAERSSAAKLRLDDFRRRARNREAQRDFRERHGNRMRYVKLEKSEG